MLAGPRAVRHGHDRRSCRSAPCHPELADRAAATTTPACAHLDDARRRRSRIGAGRHGDGSDRANAVSFVRRPAVRVPARSRGKRYLPAR